MNGSIEPTRISDRTASSPAATTQHDDRGPRRPGRPAVALRRPVAAERLARVRELVDQREHVARDQDDRDEHRFLGQRALRRRRLEVNANTAGTNRPMTRAARAATRSTTAIRWLNVCVPCRNPPIEHARPEHEQQVADDRAGQRRLDDLDQPGLQREERDDQLGDVAERRVEDAADLRAGQRAESLGREADDPGQTEDRDRRDDEDQVVVGMQPEVEDDRATLTASVTSTADAGERRECVQDGDPAARPGRGRGRRRGGHVASLSPRHGTVRSAAADACSRRAGQAHASAMAILAALFAFGSRFVGKVLTTALGWASTLLFGRVPASRQILLLGMTFGSVIWMVLLVGVVVPGRRGVPARLRARSRTFVPEDGDPADHARGALIVPGVIGALTLLLSAGTTHRARRARRGPSSAAIR